MADDFLGCGRGSGIRGGGIRTGWCCLQIYSGSICVDFDIGFQSMGLMVAEAFAMF
jgi:hypothetical protein